MDADTSSSNVCCIDNERCTPEASVALGVSSDSPSCINGQAKEDVSDSDTPHNDNDSANPVLGNGTAAAAAGELPNEKVVEYQILVLAICIAIV